MSDKPVPVEINLEALGTGTVIVDGVDLSNHVRAIRLEAVVGEPTRLVIELVPGPLELDAEAQVIVTRHAAEPNAGGLVETTSISEFQASGSWIRPSGMKKTFLEPFEGAGNDYRGLSGGGGGLGAGGFAGDAHDGK